MIRSLKTFFADENGATAIEYALIGSFIFLAIVTILGEVGSNLKLTFDSVNDGFSP